MRHKQNFTQTLRLPDGPELAFDMIFVEGGTFWMGADKASDPGAYDDEAPRHRVTVPPFFLGRVPVTQALWRAVALLTPGFALDPDPAYFKGEDRPVEQVSWDDIRQHFLPALEALTGLPFRLPTEAEWEYAARGGPQQTETLYAGSDDLDDVAWYGANSHNETKPVGLKYPNALGLFDLSGNVWEWCEDDWHGNYDNAPNDGTAWIDHPKRGGSRVRRGGGGWGDPRFCRVACRGGSYPANRNGVIGFRLASSLQFPG